MYVNRPIMGQAFSVCTVGKMTLKGTLHCRNKGIVQYCLNNLYSQPYPPEILIQPDHLIMVLQRNVL